jgi:hypothetical protein
MPKLAMALLAALALAACSGSDAPEVVRIDAPVDGDCSTADRVDTLDDGTMTCSWNCAAFHFEFFTTEVAAWTLTYAPADGGGWELVEETRDGECR